MFCVCRNRSYSAGFTTDPCHRTSTIPTGSDGSGNHAVFACFTKGYGGRDVVFVKKSIQSSVPFRNGVFPQVL